MGGCTILRFVFIVLVSLAGAPPAWAAADAEIAWAALAQGGHVALIRHTDAPGPPGDPPNFKLDDCRTQRNLSEAGRKNARAVGAALRAHGVAVDKVLGSAWCRCKDTARLMAVGAVEVFPALNNLHGRAAAEPEQSAAVRDAIAKWRGGGTLVMVSHGANIGPLTGVYPSEGEIVVVAPRPDDPRGFDVVGRIPLAR